MMVVLFLFVAWEQRKVGDIADRYDNLRIPVAANLRKKGTTPYYGANGIQDYVDGFTHEGEFVLVAEDGANDLKNYPVKCVKGKIWVNNHAHVLQGKQKTADNNFLAYLLNRTDIESLLVGGGRAKLNAEIMMGIEILLPKIEEQEVIGSFILKIDNLITLHQRKLFFIICNIVHFTRTLPLQKMTNDWEQREFGYFFNERNERSGEGELISVTINSGIKKFKELDRYDSKPEDMSNYKVVVKNDIAYNSMRMWQGASGLSPYTGILSPAYTVITPKNGISSLFFSYQIKKPEMIHLFEINSQGLTKDTWNLKFPAFSKIETSAPKKYDEQERIGNLFYKIDNLITLHQRKLFFIICNIVHFTRTLPLQKMTNDWEQRELGKVGTFTSNGVDKLSKPDEVNVNLLNYMDVYNRKKIDDTNCHSLMQVTAKPIQIKNNNIECGDVFFTPTSETAEDIGHVLVIEKALPNTVYSYHLMRYRPNQKEFFLTYPNYGFDTNELHKQMSIKAKGVQRFVILKPDFESLVVTVPNYEEQKKIAELLTNLDNLITLHQRGNNNI